MSEENAEFAAMRVAVSGLEQLDEEQRKRVLDYLNARYAKPSKPVAYRSELS